MSNMVIGDYTAAITVDGSTNYLLIQPGSASTAYRKINRSVFLGVTGQPADTSTSQNLTNKTLDNTNILTIRDDRFTLQDNADTTKQAQFQLSGITTATTRTYTLPNASSTLADIATSQTLTNKTLTAPVINNGSITGTTITTDAIVGQSAATSGTVYGLSVSSSKVGSNGVVTASITDTAVTPAKLQAGTGTGWAWQSFVPTWTNLTVGNGTTVARYVQTGKMVSFQVIFTLGNTSSLGGTPTITLPVTPSSNYIANSPNGSYIGDCQYLDASTAVYSGVGRLVTSTTIQLEVYNSSTTYLTQSDVSATVPFTFGNGDRIFIYGIYEAA